MPKASFVVLLVLPIMACGRGSVTLAGSLADSTAATAVWVAGRGDTARVENGAFRLDGVGRDSADVEFATGDGDPARMSLRAIPGGSLRLAAIWIADGLAFPGSIEEADGPVVINGLRMAPADAVPADVNLQATVLAASDDGDALLVRPVDPELPDLSVVITPRSVVRTLDGDPADPAEVEYGDSMRVSGIGQDGYVIASEIMVARAVAVRENSGADGEDDAEEPERGGVLGRLLRGRGDGGEGEGEEKGKGKAKGRD